MTDWWLLIIDCLHTDDTDGHGCPQADFVGERESSEINRELKEMGPQADEVRIQVSSNDDWLLIIDYWWLISDFWLLFDDWLLVIEYWSCFFKTLVVGGG